MNFNEAQQRAIDIGGKNIKNVLVSAGAGSGKTAVLTEKVVSLICDPYNDINIENLLVLTFTRDAAAQLKRKITDKISSKLEEQKTSIPYSDFDAYYERLFNIEEQLKNVNKADIGTIDSFCNSIVRRYFQEAGIDPSYKISGDIASPELTEIADKAINELFDKKAEERDEGFLYLMEYFSGEKYGYIGLIDVLKKILLTLDRLPNPIETLESFDYKPDSDNDIFNAQQRKNMDLFLMPFTESPEIQIINDCERLTDVLEELLKEKNNKREKEQLEKASLVLMTLNTIAGLINKKNKTYKDYYEIFNTSIPNILARSGNGIRPEVFSFIMTVKEIRNTAFRDDSSEEMKKRAVYKTNIYKTYKKYFKIKINKKDEAGSKKQFYESLIEDYKNYAKAIDYIIELYKEFYALFRKEQDKQALYSFSDISRFCIKVLLDEKGQPTETALKLREKYKLIIVDEYQDNNYMQEYILNALSDDNVFMVGDIKQSIYKFRGAVPKIFADKYNSYSKDINAVGDVCIPLSYNYRSESHVLDLTNMLFYQFMRKDFGGIDYDEHAALIRGRFKPDSGNKKILKKSKIILCDMGKNKIEVPKEENAASTTEEANVSNSVKVEATEAPDTTATAETVEAKDIEQENTLQVFESDEDEPVLEANGTTLTGSEFQAHAIAKEIIKYINPDDPYYIPDESLMEDNEVTPLCYRPCTYSDIVILLSNANSKGKDYARVLQEYGIPTTTTTKEDLFKRPEVVTMLSLYRLVDNYYQDKALVTVLRSPMFGLKTKEIAFLRAIDKDGFLYDNILTYIDIKEGNQPLKNKLISLKKLIEDCRCLLINENIEDILKGILRLSRYTDYLKLFEEGPAMLNNIKTLISYGVQLSQENDYSFGHVIRTIIEKSKEENKVEVDAASEAVNAVTITTIHKSKGLEYPVVFYSGMCDNLNPQKIDIINADSGFAFDFIDIKNRQKKDFIYAKALNYVMKLSEKMEKLRLAYVAMTRAKDRLVLVLATKDRNKFDYITSVYKDYNKEGMKMPIQFIRERPNIGEMFISAYKRCAVLNKELARMGVQTIDIDNIVEYTEFNVDDITIGNKQALEITEIFNNLNAYDIDNDTIEEIGSQFVDGYHNSMAAITPSKISVSEIKRRYQIAKYAELEADIYASGLDNPEEIIEKLTNRKKLDTMLSFERPSILIDPNKTVHGAARGTAYHAAFENLPFKKDITSAEIDEMLNRLVKNRVLTKGECDTIMYDKKNGEHVNFLNFINSHVGQMACESTEIYKEAPFVMQLPPRYVYKHNPYGNTEARMIINGIIDLFFKYGDEYILVDYKTDRVDSKNPDNTVEAVCERYRIQLKFYKKAIAKMFFLNEEPKIRMYIYFVNIGKVVLVEDKKDLFALD